MLKGTDDLVTANADKGFAIFNDFASVFNNKVSHTLLLKNRVRRGGILILQRISHVDQCHCLL